LLCSLDGGFAANPNDHEVLAEGYTWVVAQRRVSRKEQGSVIHRYIAWRHRRNTNIRLRTLVTWVNVA
jgi:hypothetical protein